MLSRFISRSHSFPPSSSSLLLRRFVSPSVSVALSSVGLQRFATVQSPHAQQYRISRSTFSTASASVSASASASHFTTAASPSAPLPRHISLFGRLFRLLFGVSLLSTSLFTAAFYHADPNEQFSIPLLLTAFQRSARIFICGVSIMLDYKYSLREFDADDRSDQYFTRLKEIHARSAQRMLELAQQCGGLMTKAAQHIASLRPAVPKEYSDALSLMQDRATPQPFQSLRQTIEEELGMKFDDIFSEFDPDPIGVASLAQVHRAKIRRSIINNKLTNAKNETNANATATVPDSSDLEVAIKIQHRDLHRLIESDLFTLSILFNLIQLAFKEFEFTWILDEFRSTIRKELKFTLEGQNAERSAKNFQLFNSLHSTENGANGPIIYVPRIYWEFTTDRLLTMEYIRGVKVNDLYSLRQLHLNPKQVAHYVTQAAAEMSFIHGFLHVDLHAGNILVRNQRHNQVDWNTLQVKESRATNWLRAIFSAIPFVGPWIAESVLERRESPQIVLLDHGMAREISESFRLKYCGLWIALVMQDAEQVKYFAESMGIAQYANILPILFTQRPLNSRSRLGYQLPKAEREKLRKDFKELRMAEVVEFLSKLPRDLLFTIRVSNLARVINFELGGTTSERFWVYADAANRGFHWRNADKVDAEVEALERQWRSKEFLTSNPQSSQFLQRITFWSRSLEIHFLLWLRDSWFLLQAWWDAVKSWSSAVEPWELEEWDKKALVQLKEKEQIIQKRLEQQEQEKNNIKNDFRPI